MRLPDTPEMRRMTTPYTPDREQLIQIIRDLLRREGASVLELRTLAHRSALPEDLLRHHFPDRSALIRALYSHWMDDLEQRLWEASDPAPAAFLATTARIYREQAKSDPALFLASHGEPEIFNQLQRSHAFRLFADYIRAGMEHGLLQPSPDPEAAASALWSAVHGAVTFEILLGREDVLSTLSPLMVRAMSLVEPV